MRGVLLLLVGLLRVFADGQEIAPSSRHLSGTKLPRGSALVFNDGVTGSISLTHMSLRRHGVTSSYGVVCYQDVRNNNSGMCSGLMLSDMELVKGADSIFNMGDTNFISVTCIYHQYQQACTVCYEDAVSDSQGTCNAYVSIAGPGPAVHLNSVPQASDVSISFVSAVHFSDAITVSCHQTEGLTGVGSCIGLRRSGSVLEKFGQFDFSFFAAGVVHESWISVASFSETAGVVCYHHKSSSSFGRCTAFSVTGAVLTEGASVDFNVGMTTRISVARFTDAFGVVCYQDGDNGNRGTCNHLLLSGMTPVCGADVIFGGGATYFISVARLSDTSGIVCYQDGASNGLGKCTGLGIFGNTVFKAGDIVFSSGSATSISVAGFADMIGVVCYQDISNNKHGTCTAVLWPALTNSTTTTTTTTTTNTTTTTTHPTTATATIATTKTPAMTPLSSPTTTRSMSATTSFVSIDAVSATTTSLDAPGTAYAASSTLTISTFPTTTTITSTMVITLLQASQATIASTTPATIPTTMQPRLSTTTTSLTTTSLSFTSSTLPFILPTSRSTSFTPATIVYIFTTSTTTSTPHNASNATAPIVIAQRVVSQDLANPPEFKTSAGSGVTLGIPLTIGLSCLACLGLALWGKQRGGKRQFFASTHKPINSDHKGCPATLAPADDLSDIVIDCEFVLGTLGTHCSGSGEMVESKLHGLWLPLDMACSSPLSMKHVATPSTEAESSSTSYSGLTYESPSLVFSPRTESSESHYLDQFTAPEDAAALEVPHSTSNYVDDCWQGQSSGATETAFWDVLPSTNTYECAFDDQCIAPVNPSASTFDAQWVGQPRRLGFL